MRCVEYPRLHPGQRGRGVDLVDRASHEMEKLTLDIKLLLFDHVLFGKNDIPSNDVHKV